MYTACSELVVFDRSLVEAVQGIALSEDLSSAIYLNFIVFHHVAIMNKSEHVCGIVSNHIRVLGTLKQVFDRSLVEVVQGIAFSREDRVPFLKFETF